MVGHFDLLGFPVETPEALQQLASYAATRGEAVAVEKGYYIHFSAGGPELWVQATPQRQLVGCNPHFAGKSKFRARIDSVCPDAQGPFDGSVQATAVETGGIDYPFQCDVPDFASVAPKLNAGGVAMFQIAAFADEIQWFKDDVAFRAAPSSIAKLATEAFIPSGLFFPMEPT